MAKFSKEEKIILLIIFFAFISGIFINFFFAYKQQIKEVDLQKDFVKININKADIDEISKLPGIGPAFARKIIEYREKNGNFKTKEDIMKVKGIGIKKYEKIKNLITIDE